MRFIIIWGCALLGLAGGAVGFNIVVDPYMLFDSPRIAGFNERKVSVETHERLMKAYQVTRVAPRGLLLGTSRVDIGMDPKDGRWPAEARPVYNLGIAGAGPYLWLRYLQHASLQTPVRLVVLGLDFEYFLTEDSEAPPTEVESRLNATRDGRPNAQRYRQELLDIAQATASIDALSNSVATIIANRAPSSADLSASGVLSDAWFRHDIARIGSASLFEETDLKNLHKYATLHPVSGEDYQTSLAMKHVRTIVDLCQKEDIDLILFIEPMHVDLLETFDLLGYWSGFESWKRALAALVSERNATGGRTLQLWDFSGFDAYSGEEVPRPGDRRAATKWFLEPAHYTRSLGEIMLARVFGAERPDFGAQVTAASIDTRLAQIRSDRERYRYEHPQALQRVRAIYATLVQSPASPKQIERSQGGEVAISMALR